MRRVACCRCAQRLQNDFRIARADEVHQLFAVFADERLLVVASNVVPFDSVVVEVVQDGQARLSLIIFAIVGLRAAITTSVRPVTKSTLVGGGDLGLRTGPEPSVDNDRLQISAVASVEVAFAAAGPDVLDSIASHLLLNEFVFLQSLHGDGIHAVATADVTGIEPVDFQVLGGSVQPAEEVVVSVAQRISPHGVLDTFGTRFGVRKSQHSLGGDGAQAAYDEEQGLQQHSSAVKRGAR